MKKTVRFKPGILLLLILTAGSAGAEDLFSARIYLAGSGRQKLLFNYTNEIEISENKETLTHDFYSTDGSLFAREQLILKEGKPVSHTTDFFELKEYSLLEWKGDKIAISFTRDGKTKTRSTENTDELIFGPTQQLFIRRSLPRFIRGEVLNFRIPAPEFGSLVAFTMKRTENTGYERPGVIVLEMKTRSLLLRILADSNFFVVDAQNGNILEIHGPSILPVRDGERWKYVDVDILFTYDREEGIR